MTRQTILNPKESEMATTQAPQAETARGVALHAARIQLASITAASKFFTGWVQSADRYLQAVSDELLDRVRGETESTELVARLATASTEFLGEVTALPNAAVRHFNREVKRATNPRKS
jgi:hypothetical protein